MHRFDFADWLNRQIGKSYEELLREAEAAGDQAERVSRNRKSKHREYAAEFVDRVGRLLFWLRHGARPDGVSATDWDLYSLICQSLIDQGQYKPESMKPFRHAKGE